MNIFIEPLRQRDAIRRLLKQHGWRLDKERGGYLAQHRDVQDQTTARQTLSDLGLLTSSAVRIDFLPSVTL